MVYHEYFSLVAQVLCLCYRTKLKRDHADAYGTLTKNSTWTGMIALLVNGDVEMAVGDFTMNTQRIKAVGFTVPVSESVYGSPIISNAVKFMFCFLISFIFNNIY